MINEASLAPIKLNIESWKQILILTSQNANIDRLAAILTLYLGLQKLNKKVQVATEANLTVSQTQLFGIGEIGNRFPQLKGGDMTLTLENVVIDQGPDAGKVPALEKLDWFPAGKDLKLVFHVVSGQRFEPSNVGVSYAEGKYDAIIVVGAASLDNLGKIYSANKATFGTTEIINIDNQPNNMRFGAVNIVEPEAGTVSEMMVSVLNQLGVGLDADMASNVLMGIYNATHNLTQKVTAETFLAVGQAMQAGGRNPQVNKVQTGSGFQVTGSGQFRANPQQGNNRQQPQQPQQPRNQQRVSSQQNPPREIKKENPFLATPTSNVSFNPVFTPQFQPEMPNVESAETQQSVSVMPEEVVSDTPRVTGGFDLKGFNQKTEVEPVVTESEPVAVEDTLVNDEEIMEAETEFNPAPDWLTPKVYKSGGLG